MISIILNIVASVLAGVGVYLGLEAHVEADRDTTIKKYRWSIATLLTAAAASACLIPLLGPAAIASGILSVALSGLVLSGLRDVTATTWFGAGKVFLLGEDEEKAAELSAVPEAA